jgi:hypothetical protein
MATESQLSKRSALPQNSKHVSATTMAPLSKRKRMLMLLAVLASLSNAFIVTPNVKVFPAITGSQQKILPACSLQGRNGKAQSQLIPVQQGGKNLSLNFFFGNQDPATSHDHSSRDETSSAVEQAGGGRLGMVLLQAGEVIRPAADALDGATGGWALSYADLAPETQQTPVGRAFLASNLAYAIVGLALSANGDLILGSLTELCSIASFIYHYTQLDMESRNDTVRFALFIDYVLAFSAIFVGLGYILMDGQVPPMEGLISASVAIGFFLLGLTVCAEGMAYVAVHSLWHVFSAYSAYLVGNTHITNTFV